MSKRPESSPPPGRPGPARRSGVPTPYKRPVQWPDAETVMLPSFKDADPDITSEPGPGEPADPGIPAQDPPAASTRVLSL
jgi:hypothetical protein